MDMITIRAYRESDAESVGILIADTYGEFNLSFVPPGERGPFLGPFQHARSPDESHREAISRVISAPIVLVAENDGEIVGVLRGGRKDERQRVVLPITGVGSERNWSSGSSKRACSKERR